jgi:hypothetical protein
MGKETKVFEIDDTIYSECCVKLNQKEYFIGNLNSKNALKAKVLLHLGTNEKERR